MIKLDNEEEICGLIQDLVDKYSFEIYEYNQAPSFEKREKLQPSLRIGWWSIIKKFPYDNFNSYGGWNLLDNSYVEFSFSGISINGMLLTLVI